MKARRIWGPTLSRMSDLSLVASVCVLDLGLRVGMARSILSTEACGSDTSKFDSAFSVKVCSGVGERLCRFQT